MTSIRETASETLHFTAGLGWANAGGLSPEITASTTPLAGISWEPLLQLDAAGWAQVFADNHVDRDSTRRLDRLVATWLTQDDYRGTQRDSFQEDRPPSRRSRRGRILGLDKRQCLQAAEPPGNGDEVH